MKFLFFDLEYASSTGATKICEFGYVMTDENFNVLKRDNFVINPKLRRKDWDWYALRKVLTKELIEYESGLDFKTYYPLIKALINEADYVVGHTIDGDAKALNDDCKRYNLPSLDYDFYNTKLLFEIINNTNKDISVINILKFYNVQGEENAHDAGVDAYNTMLGLKIMLEKLNINFNDAIQTYPSIKDSTKDYVVKSIAIKEAKEEENLINNLSGDSTNDIEDGSLNKERYSQFLDNVKPNSEGSNLFKDKKISFSFNYLDHHYSQILNLIQLIVNEGGTYTKKASESDIYIKYDDYLEDGTLKEDIKIKYVKEAINNGSDIKIIDFEEFLNMLNISEAKLNDMPRPSFEFLLKNGAIIKGKRLKAVIDKIRARKKKESKPYNTQSGGYTMGDYFKANNIGIN